MKSLFLVLLVLLSDIISVKAQSDSALLNKKVITGAERLNEYLPLLKGKTVALVANNTSRINKTHLADTLLDLKVNLVKVFSPEHGFRGTADAGEVVGNYVDEETKLPVVSLYGNAYKPKAFDLKGLDYVIFDIQDVGARFYTYISTMHYVMEACAENNVSVIILDRPNPNGFYVDGPVREKKYKSFVGMHPVPIVHGLTIGEYACMINGEKWLSKGLQCNLKIISCLNYTHDVLYSLPVKPSPNLPGMNAVYLYPSLCLFEGTTVSVGRGTTKPFEQFGAPGMKNAKDSFIPRSMPGAKNPPYKDTLCDAIILSDSVQSHINSKQINLDWLINAYANKNTERKFFVSYFDRLAGNGELRKQIVSNKSVEEIRASWKPALDEFKVKRKKYLLYPDFN